MTKTQSFISRNTDLKKKCFCNKQKKKKKNRFHCIISLSSLSVLILSLDIIMLISRAPHPHPLVLGHFSQSSIYHTSLWWLYGVCIQVLCTLSSCGVHGLLCCQIISCIEYNLSTSVSFIWSQFMSFIQECSKMFLILPFFDNSNILLSACYPSMKCFKILKENMLHCNSAFVNIMTMVIFVMVMLKMV